ncbi:palmitoyl-acyl carrier protein thioesterase, chloroplastic-like [Juglans microcarpa x Juglans regia]|uniref:palmitoyl-acyl carrier protein thioesterase, chloroplastic-like n=1 Tax=Juglans microcarpa x Juglans regia TaxID=2249226 RepID=UPI001B7D99BD|nr:palmitoyl-acyl carrier protein thioesterase, chloroplastic-like [Juglans microcarpa x Juglans regia]
MASLMAAKGNTRLCLGGGFCKADTKNVATRKIGCYPLMYNAIKLKQRSLSVIASARSSRGIDSTINGSMVHGINLGEVAPVMGNKNRESTKEISGVDAPLHAVLLGRFVEDQFVYRQTFIIRSYEIGPDKTATMETLMNLLQETALNHVTSSGLAGNGFGATREMSLRKLIWVVTRIHIQVQRYSSWGDVVEIDTWVDATGKNGMRRDWIIRDYKTQEIITRATSTWVIMNQETRRLSKIPEQVREEVVPFYLNRVAVASDKNDSEKIDKLTDKTAERIRSGLAPRWSDMDANQHVNNVKYIGWILESVPINVLGNYDLTSMTLEYRRECQQSNLLESLTSSTASGTEDSNNYMHRRPDLEFTHLLRMLADKAEIVRARTQWHSKQKLN